MKLPSTHQLMRICYRSDEIRCHSVSGRSMDFTFNLYMDPLFNINLLSQLTQLLIGKNKLSSVLTLLFKSVLHIYGDVPYFVICIYLFEVSSLSYRYK